MEIRLDQIDPDALRVLQRLRRYQHKAYVVGGCVRDLLLGRKPKDFDVATSATPSEIRRCFRNCRIIGRRFRLAHVFFGRKIIETATFRANPRAPEDESSETPAEEKGPDLLIRRDNVFGTEEQSVDGEVAAAGCPTWKRAWCAPSAIPTSAFAKIPCVFCARSSSPLAAT